MAEKNRTADRGPKPKPESGPVEKPRTIEVPGRPEADREPKRDKAYGPGGATPDGGTPSKLRDAAPIGEPTSDIDDPPLPGEAPGAGRTAEGADTKPL